VKGPNGGFWHWQVSGLEISKKEPAQPFQARYWVLLMTYLHPNSFACHYIFPMWAFLFPDNTLLTQLATLFGGNF